jgi:NAD(P)-dependent dehydrogenase (short-subunit alcohol dehydrogenase family)
MGRNLGTLVGYNEDFVDVAYHKEVYDLIDPKQFYDSQTFLEKVVFITGASRGIGAATALQYARAGASVALASRGQAALDQVKSDILLAVPTARVLVLPVDVTQTQEMKGAIAATVAQFGRLDIAVANAGKAGAWTEPILNKDPDEWWSVVEVGLKGVFNTIYFSLPHLIQSKGCVVTISSRAAQVRLPFASDYCVAKHALGRLVEQFYLEYPEIRIFNLHPGSPETEMGLNTNHPIASDPPDESIELPGAAMLYLTAGKADWLVGRFVSSNWDLGEIESQWKEKIIESNALISKLHIPN